MHEDTTYLARAARAAFARAASPTSWIDEGRVGDRTSLPGRTARRRRRWDSRSDSAMRVASADRRMRAPMSGRPQGPPARRTPFVSAVGARVARPGCATTPRRRRAMPTRACTRASRARFRRGAPRRRAPAAGGRRVRVGLRRRTTPRARERGRLARHPVARRLARQRRARTPARLLRPRVCCDTGIRAQTRRQREASAPTGRRFPYANPTEEPCPCDTCPPSSPLSFSAVS